MNVPWYSIFMVLYIFIFWFRTTARKDTWMRAISVTVMVIIFMLQFWKFLDISYVQRSFPTIMRHNDNGIWKTPYSGRFYRRGIAYVLILSWVLNIMKPKWMKVREKLSVGHKSEPVFRKALYQDTSLIIAFFFLCWTNLVFVFNVVLIE